MPKTPKRPRDMMELAKLIGEIATHEATEPELEPTDVAAVKRGEARAKKLTPARRKQIGRQAAAARWGKKRKG